MGLRKIQTETSFLCSKRAKQTKIIFSVKVQNRCEYKSFLGADLVVNMQQRDMNLDLGGRRCHMHESLNPEESVDLDLFLNDSLI